MTKEVTLDNIFKVQYILYHKYPFLGTDGEPYKIATNGMVYFDLPMQFEINADINIYNGSIYPVATVPDSFDENVFNSIVDEQTLLAVEPAIVGQNGLTLIDINKAISDSLEHGSIKSALDNIDAGEITIGEIESQVSSKVAEEVSRVVQEQVGCSQVVKVSDYMVDKSSIESRLLNLENALQSYL